MSSLLKGFPFGKYVFLTFVSILAVFTMFFIENSKLGLLQMSVLMIFSVSSMCLCYRKSLIKASMQRIFWVIVFIHTIATVGLLAFYLLFDAIVLAAFLSVAAAMLCIGTVILFIFMAMALSALERKLIE